MASDVCTDVILNMALELPYYFDWELFATHFADPNRHFRSFHPHLRIHISSVVRYLLTRSQADMFYLMEYLDKMNATSLNVVLSTDTNLSQLFFLLEQLQNLLHVKDVQLTITVPSQFNVEHLLDFGMCIRIRYNYYLNTD